MLAVYSPLVSRLIPATGFRLAATPKSTLLLGPTSLSCTTLSCQVGAPTSAGSHVDVPAISTQSNQSRVSVLAVFIGLYFLAKLPAIGRTYLLAPNLTAVFPS